MLSFSMQSPKKSGHKTKEDASKPGETEEEEDKPEPAPMGRVMKLNAPEWPYMAVGSFFAALVGAFPVLFAFILSELIEVSVEIRLEILLGAVC